MQSQSKTVDTFQIVGFILSVAISLGLIFIGKDTVQSITLGLVLAILTQLFDLQIRYSDSEERLMQANALSQALYGNTWLLKHIQNIVNDYLTVDNGWFEIYKFRANDVLTDCQNILHGMAEGNLVVVPPSPFSFGRTFSDAEKTINHASAITDINYWKTVYAEKALGQNKKLVERGVSFTRIFIQPIEILREMVDILENQRDIGINVFVVLPDDLPHSARQDYIIVDDRAAARQVANIDGKLKEQIITIDQVEVAKMSKDFYLLRHYAINLEQIIDKLK